MAETPSDVSEVEEHLKRVQSVTDATLAHLTVDSLLNELLVRIRDLLRADTAAVLLLDEKSTELVATAAKGIEEEVEQGVRLPVGRGFAGKIAATREPVILERVDHNKVLNPLLVKRGIRSLLGVPMIAGGRTVGVLHVGTLVPRKFTRDDVELLRLAGDRVALAIDAQHHREHRVIAETLQRSLLPDRFPRVHDMEIAGYYHPAKGGMVGGDWYDVFVVDPDMLCVVVGDIAGKGVTAAIEMGRLRNAVRAMAFLDARPGLTVSRLNDFLLHFEPGVMATLLMGIIEPNGTVRYASAGHVPPVVVNADGVAELVFEPAEPPLGAAKFMTYRDRVLNLEPQSTLILYTDGLVERRGRPLEVGLEALRSAAETDWTNLETLRQRIFSTGDSSDQTSDDLAILSLRFQSSSGGDGIHATIEADPRQLAPLRRKVRRWLVDKNVDQQQTQDVLVAVGEAVANSIEHAYGPGQGSIQLDASESAGLLTIRVRDNGLWRKPRGTGRGLGRSLMKELMDDASFETDASGTLVTLQKKIDPAS